MINVLYDTVCRQNKLHPSIDKVTSRLYRHFKLFERAHTMITMIPRAFPSGFKIPSYQSKPIISSVFRTIDRASPCRRFHSSPLRRFLDLNTCYALTHTALTGLHSVTGLSWAATIPCAALIIRGVILSPISIYTHKIRERRKPLRPLILAWAHIISRKVLQEHGKEGPTVFRNIAVKESSAKGKEIAKRHRAQTWKLFLPIVQMPVFLVMIETLRKMCGIHGGLLSLFSEWYSKSDETTFEHGVEGRADHMLRPSTLPFEHADHSVVIPFEKSFATEGALWFPDLLVPDPLLILPFVLSGAMFLNIYYQSILAKGAIELKWQTRIRNIFKIMALAVGPLTLQVPSGILVYWISSSLCAVGSNMALEAYLPRAPSFKPPKSRDKLLPIGARPKK